MAFFRDSPDKFPASISRRKGLEMDFETDISKKNISQEYKDKESNITKKATLLSTREVNINFLLEIFSRYPVVTNIKILSSIIAPAKQAATLDADKSGDFPRRGREKRTKTLTGIQPDKQNKLSWCYS